MCGQTLLSAKGGCPSPTNKKVQPHTVQFCGAVWRDPLGQPERFTWDGETRRLFLGLTLSAATAERRRQGRERSPWFPAWRWEPEAPSCLPGGSGTWGQAPLTLGHWEKAKLGGGTATLPLRRPPFLQWGDPVRPKGRPKSGEKGSHHF